MCGLVGIFDRRGHALRMEASLKIAADAIAHRGPDDEGFWFSGPVGLGFRRLSILDLTLAGHQPFASQDGEWTLVFNGEIYNFIELAEELGREGVQFHTRCDTEVLVEALAHWGTSAFDRLNGMWSVLAWHTSSRTLYACRDPWGIKPLFVSDQGDFVGFSSEIKGLKALGCAHRGVAPSVAREFLDAGMLDTGTATMFDGYERLLPGWLYAWREGVSVHKRQMADGTRNVDLPWFHDTPSGESAFLESFRAALLNSVRLRLRADVDVGTCLSGGLDSTTIACAAARFREVDRVKTCLHAFTALLPEFDETAFIRPVIAQTGAEWHTTVAADDQLLEKATTFFRTHDEPVHSLSPFAGYLVMGLAAQANVKVLLNGQGADELLAGYNSSVGPFLRSVTAQDGLHSALRESIAEAGSPAAGARLLARTLSGAAMRKISPGTLHWLTQMGLAGPGTSSVNRKVHPNGPLGPRNPPREPPSHSLAASLADQQHYSPLPLYLRIEDANSSAFSLEARLPFLDPTVVAIARAAPPRMLRRGGLNKYMLRAILPGLVPDVVWQRRDKMGFPVPNERWLRGPLREMLMETLSTPRLQARGWYNVPEVVRSRDALLRSTDATQFRALRSIFLLERWARDHLDSPVAVRPGG